MVVNNSFLPSRSNHPSNQQYGNTLERFIRDSQIEEHREQVRLCNKEELIVEGADATTADILKSMAERCLCRSFKQHKKFSALPEKVIAWIQSQPEMEERLL